MSSQHMIDFTAKLYVLHLEVTLKGNPTQSKTR